MYYVHLLEPLLLASAKSVTLYFVVLYVSARDTELTVCLPVLPCDELCIVIRIIR